MPHKKYYSRYDCFSRRPQLFLFEKYSYCRKGGIGGILEFFLLLIPLFVFFRSMTFAFCAGPEAELMEQFSGIDQEDVRYYLLEGWKGIGTLIEKSQLHFLPNPQMGYDIIESLQGSQFKDLIDSLVLSMMLKKHPGVHDAVLPQIIEPTFYI